MLVRLSVAVVVVVGAASCGDLLFGARDFTGHPCDADGGCPPPLVCDPGEDSASAIDDVCVGAGQEGEGEEGEGVGEGEGEGDGEGEGEGEVACVVDDECSPGQVCVRNVCRIDTDTDSDGLVDAFEDANDNGVVDPSETDPSEADTDGDTISDGVEVNGSYQGAPRGAPSDADPVSEGRQTDPLDPDSDDDALCDGPARVAAVALICEGAEDTNANGLLDAGDTDPTDRQRRRFSVSAIEALDPFPDALGNFDFAGNVTIDTDSGEVIDDLGEVLLTVPLLLFSTVIVQDGGPEILLLHTALVEIGPGELWTVRGERALAFHTFNANIAGVIDLSAVGATSGPGGVVNGVGANALQTGSGGGGAYGTGGSDGADNNGNVGGGGGRPHGFADLHVLSGGSAGGSGRSDLPPTAAGGGGGGALYISAVRRSGDLTTGRIVVPAGGEIRANGAGGADAGPTFFGAGGGGSGGAVFLEANEIDLDGLISVRGANGGLSLSEGAGATHDQVAVFADVGAGGMGRVRFNARSILSDPSASIFGSDCNTVVSAANVVTTDEAPRLLDPAVVTIAGTVLRAPGDADDRLGAAVAVTRLSTGGPLGFVGVPGLQFGGLQDVGATLVEIPLEDATELPAFPTSVAPNAGDRIGTSIAAAAFGNEYTLVVGAPGTGSGAGGFFVSNPSRTPSTSPLTQHADGTNLGKLVALRRDGQRAAIAEDLGPGGLSWKVHIYDVGDYDTTGLLLRTTAQGPGEILALAYEGDTLAVACTGPPNLQIFRVPATTAVRDTAPDVEGQPTSLALARDESTLVIGVQGQQRCGPGTGGAFLLARDPPTNWVNLEALRDPDPAIGGVFGNSVAIDGDRVLVAAGGRGAVVGLSLERRSATALLVAPGVKDMGNVVDVEGDSCLVGAPGDDDGGATPSRGAVVTFTNLP
ncbi:MAG: hypothetical protein Q8O67_19120 [Deltaproteobacteria bacterium]|nr:hypothetical protein [Deltaproteobacteria bacterium]